jgi:hypothetical protein
MRALLILLVAALSSTVANAEPPKRVHWWDVLTVLHGPAPDARLREHVAPPRVVQEPKQKKPKPCGCYSQPESEVGNAAFQSGDGAG